ncbi:hypothetical protein [Sorangium sp. So ce117]|uniref:hypothetical protein n=1 Tax=Sorangium sp. So ce117 TaxID=3133277 RepID=UPI003F6085CC
MVTVNDAGAEGTGVTAQCSGWFPDWISSNPPPAGTASFQLSQAYPLGIPILKIEGENIRITGWDPPPSASVQQAPWLQHDFHDPAQRPAYLDALKNYLLEGNDTNDFDVSKNTQRSWYHVPMMTSDNFSRREPYHGLTKERALRSTDHKWIIDGTGGSANLNSYAIGAYNALGGYTIGQVFKDPNPANSDPSKGKFIEGAYVFKILFAEYDSAKIDAGQDPLVGAPEWQIQDIADAAGPLRKVRLLQVDVAVRDGRSAQTGWVFATFVYDKSMAGEANPWRRLRPVGLMWGNDPDVNGPGAGVIDETFLSPDIPANLQRQDGNPYGRDGRLNGPVDNRFSSCLSCHSTAQVVVGATTRNAFRGVDLFPPPPSASCTSPMVWFRNVPAGTPFGVMTNGGNGCDLDSPATATPSLHGVDYSLQLADALEASLFDRAPNPCQALAEELKQVDSRTIPPGDRRGRSIEEMRRTFSAEVAREPRKLKDTSDLAQITRKRAKERKLQTALPANVITAQKGEREGHRR